MDGLENEWREQLLVIRLNIQEEVGQELAPVYGFKFTPTFIFFDGDGNEAWRQVGGLDPDKVRESLE